LARRKTNQINIGGVLESKIKSILDSVNDITLPVWDKAMIEGAYLHHFDAGGDIAISDEGAYTLKAGADSVCIFAVIANNGVDFKDI